MVLCTVYKKQNVFVLVKTCTYTSEQCTYMFIPEMYEHHDVCTMYVILVLGMYYSIASASGILTPRHKRVYTCLTRDHVYDMYILCYHTTLSYTWYIHVHTSSFIEMYIHVHDTVLKIYKHVCTW